jgi:hypothetical protein
MDASLPAGDAALVSVQLVITLPPGQNELAVHTAHPPPVENWVGSPTYPGLQLQSLISSLPRAEFACVGQLLATLPPLQNLPASHGVHSPPLIPEYPAIQEQPVISALPGGEDENEGQSMLLVPPGQWSSSGHCVQAPPSGPYVPALHLQSSITSLP